ncbi:hypothetical protein BJ741DRAFT_603895 [Chytriomyces cf. hyalinus JEL632]|nr:hypothetical protein BJ741DRAFT_603895 [Chytriomyces cf. hyalinus JEL632]
MEQVDPFGPFADILSLSEDEQDANTQEPLRNGDEIISEAVSSAPDSSGATHDTPLSWWSLLSTAIACFSSRQLHVLSSNSNAPHYAQKLAVYQPPKCPVSSTTLAVSAALAFSLSWYANAHVEGMLFTVPAAVACIQHIQDTQMFKRRLKVVNAFEVLEKKSILFDESCNKAVKTIQEIELVAKGYNLRSSTNSITASAIANSAFDKSCKLLQSQILRNACTSLLNESISALQESCILIETVCPEQMTRFFWSPNDVQDVKILQDARTHVDGSSLEGIKLAHLELKLRRIWFCQWISAAIPSGSGSDVQHLREIENAFLLVGRVVDTLAIKQAMLEKEMDRSLTSHLNFDPFQFIPHEKPQASSFRTSLAMLHRALRSATIKLAILGDAFNDSIEPRHDTLSSHLDAIGIDLEDLEGLLSTCRLNLNSLFNPTQERGLLEDTENSDDAKKHTRWDDAQEFCEGKREFQDLSDKLERIGDEVVFEGEHEEIAKKMISRQERIAIQKQKREEEATHKAASQLSLHMISELKTVLQFRKPANAANDE